MRLFGLHVGTEDALVAELRGLREEIAGLKVEREAASKASQYQREVLTLTEQVETLKIQKNRLNEEQAQKEREVRHEVGLLRKQVEAEREIAVSTAKLDVQKENLDTERSAFEKEMKFTRERFGEEVKYLRGIAEAMLARLPTVEVNKRVTLHEGDPAPATKSAAKKR